MDEWRPKQSLADDPAFLASLDGLDQGLAAEKASPTAKPAAAKERPGPVAQAEPAASRPQPVARPRTATAAPPPNERAADPESPRPKPPRRRSVLELFPPAAPPAPAATPSPQPPAPPQPRAATPPSAARAPADAPKPARRSAEPIVVPPPTTPAVPVRAARYLTYYSLDEDPFAPTADPRFFFHATSHDDASQELLSAIRRREAVVVVTGPEGVGKTTLCQTVVEHLDRRTLTSFIAEAPRTFEALAATALVDFGVISREELEQRSPPADELVSAFREFLKSLGPLQAFAVLFLDNAHRVPSPVLRDVARLADTTGDERLLEIVLVGSPRLEQKLRRRELRTLAANVTVRCRIAPLEPTEISSYVMHRLTTAGPNPRVDFNDPAFARLHELSRGLPALINELSNRALDLGAASAASVIDRELVDQASAELGIEPPQSPVLVAMRATSAVMLFALLVLGGAAAAAYVFSDRVGAVMTRWEQIPPAPARPPLPHMPPLAPVAPPNP